MKNCKRLACLALALTLCLSALPMTAQAAGFTRTRTYNGQFTDVPANSYYAAAVKDCYELNLLSGTGDTTFSPEGMYTVAQALVVAARMHAISNGGSDSFPAGTPWYQPYVSYCINQGIITGTTFESYTRNITRAEMAMLFVAALPSSTWTNVNKVSALPDVSSTTDHYMDIMTLYRSGILKGKDEYGTYNPYAAVSRAEVATMIQRIVVPEQRQTFTLTPLSQREAPAIIGNLSAYDYAVGNGLMRFRDSESRLYGYMDANTGAIRIAAQFNEAWDFYNGYAAVKMNGKWGMIDTTGKVTLPIAYYSIRSLGYGVYSARTTSGGLLAVIINGTLSGDIVYSELGCNGLYIFGRRGTQTWDVMSMDGNKLTTIDAPINWAEKSYLFKAKNGNKWALASENGLITDFLYDSITLYEKVNAKLATGKIGNRTALLGLNGVVPGLDLDDGYSFNLFYGDFALVYKGDEHAIADANGIRSELIKVGNCEWSYTTKDLVVVSSWNGYYTRFVYDISTGKTLTAEGNFRDDGYILLSDGVYAVKDSTKCKSVSNVANGYFTFTTLDGKYGLLHNGQVVSPGIYSSPDEAIEAYDYYKSQNVDGKPTIQMGNDVKGFEPVIQYYKNSLPYDEIRSVGEGYYACRYNTTWYLLHV